MAKLLLMKNRGRPLPPAPLFALLLWGLVCLLSTATAFCPPTTVGSSMRQVRAPLFAIRAQKVQTAIQSNNAFRGKLMIVMSKLLVGPAKYAEVVRRVLEQTYWPEIVLITVLICGTMPLAEYVYRGRHADLVKNDDDEKDDNEEAKNKKEETLQKAFQASRTLKVARILRQLGLLQAMLYASDVLWVILKHLDFKFVVKYQAQQITGSMISACWLAWNTSRLKSHYLTRRETTSKSSLANANGTIVRTTPRTLNRLADIFIYACAFLTVIDLLGIEIGFALKSIFGLGSFGTLALSLASKDLAAEFVGGLMIQTSNFFNEGEMVVLQDGTKGSVAKIGWLHTYIYKKEDNSIVRVPNSQISHQRISRERRERTRRGSRNF